MPAAPAVTDADRALEEITDLLRKCKDGGWRRRLRAVAMVMEDARKRCETVRWLKADRQSMSDRFNRYNAGGPDGLKKRPLQACARA